MADEDILNDLSETEFEALRDKARSLLKEVEPLNGICAAMIASRRLYSVAMAALIEALDGQWNAEMLRAYFVAALKAEAEKEFTGSEFHNSIASVILPWLQQEIASSLDASILDDHTDGGESNRDHENNGKV